MFKQNILDTISLWGAIGLLWFSFITMIGEYFPEFLQVVLLTGKVENSLSGSINPNSLVNSDMFVTIGMDWGIISFLVIVLWLGYDWPKDYLKKLVLPCRFIGFLIPVGYTLVNLEKIIDGFVQIISQYVVFVNAYYKTRFSIMQVHGEENSVVAFTAICMFLWLAIWMIAYGSNKKVLLLLFPMVALGLELAVGLSPVGGGLWYVLFAGILILNMGGYSFVKKVVALVLVAGCVLFSGVVFKEDIERLSTLDAKQELLRWQNNISLDDINIFKLLQLDLHFNWEPLNNNAPQYTGETVLEIESDMHPLHSVYLKGFYGTNYENGSWTYEDSAFKAACREAGKNPSQVAEQIFQMPYERRIERASYEQNQRMNFKINYTGTTGDVAYAPYLSDYTSMDDKYSFLGDYLLKKSILDSAVEGTLLEVNMGMSNWSTINLAIEKGFGNFAESPYMSVSLTPIDLTSQKEELDWINGLADAYLQVPESAEYLDDVLLKVNTIMRTQSSSMDYKIAMELDVENAKRLLYATAVKTYLADQMSYSLRLNALPYEADPIEYALMESHEGYCMHFASAATLILRKAGVPARYVSGYTVEPIAFSYDGDIQSYRAEVGDFMAHAWVEIYLDYIGWVPLEVTPGSSLSSLPTEEEIQNWESQSNAHRQQIVDAEGNTNQDDVVVPPTETEEDTQDSQTEDTQGEPQTPQTQRPPGMDAYQEPTTAWDILWAILKILGVLCIIGAIVSLVIYLFRRWERNYDSILEREMKQEMTRLAIKRINRRMYGMLCVSKPANWFQHKWTDVTYRDALVVQFSTVTEEEWERYMTIVKKNHYSKEEISYEEMQFCYTCYKKVRGK